MGSMMAKKCDICGTLYEQQCIPDVRIIIYCHPYGDTWLDLCPKCQERLDRFVGVCQQEKARKPTLNISEMRECADVQDE